MFCALDVQLDDCRMTLTTTENGEPFLLEKACFQTPVDEARVVAQVQAWSQFYSGLDGIVFSDEGFPDALVAALAPTAPVRRVAGSEVALLVGVYESIRLDRRWIRSGLMSLMASRPFLSLEDAQRSAMDWTYAWLTGQIQDLARDYQLARTVCPGHFRLQCERCLPPVRCEVGGWCL